MRCKIRPLLTKSRENENGRISDASGFNKKIYKKNCESAIVGRVDEKKEAEDS